jgi:hypothetical protein
MLRRMRLPACRHRDPFPEIPLSAFRGSACVRLHTTTTERHPVNRGWLLGGWNVPSPTSPQLRRHGSAPSQSTLPGCGTRSTTTSAIVSCTRRCASTAPVVDALQRLRDAISAAEHKVEVETAIVAVLAAHSVGMLTPRPAFQPPLTAVEDARLTAAEKSTPAEAKTDLDRAEQRLRDAEQRLRDAKQDLRDAKPELGSYVMLPWPAVAKPDFPTPNGLKWITPDSNAGPWCVAKSDAALIVRACHAFGWDRFQHACKVSRLHHPAGFLIIGHPGIGKSCFLDVLLVWSLDAEPERPVIVIAVAGVTVFININGLKKQRFVFGDQPSSRSFIAWLMGLGVPSASPIVILHDVKHIATLGYRAGFVENLSKCFAVTCVLAASPDQNNHQQFRKDTECGFVFWMPTLTLAESVEYLDKAHGVTSAEAEERFAAVGGVPRHFQTEDSVAVAKTLQLLAASNVECDPSKFTSLKDSSKIVQTIPTPDFKGCLYTDFVSADAREAWIAKKELAAPDDLWQRYRKAVTGNFTSDVIGRFFEEWVLCVLRSPSSRDAIVLSRREVRPAGNDPLQRWALPGPLVVCLFQKPAQVHVTQSDTLWIPTVSNFGVVDAILTRATPGLAAAGAVTGTATLIQITVADSHEPTRSAVDELYSALLQNHITVTEMVWIVSAARADFSWQRLKKNESHPLYDGTPQYVCCLSNQMSYARMKGHTEKVSVPQELLPLGDSTGALAVIQRLVDKTATVVTGGDGSKASPYVFTC